MADTPKQRDRGAIDDKNVSFVSISSPPENGVREEERKENITENLMTNKTCSLSLFFGVIKGILFHIAGTRQTSIAYPARYNNTKNGLLFSRKNMR